MVTVGVVGGGSRPYTIDEDDRIIQLIFMTRTGNSLRGNSVWQDFANTNRFPGRSWQSLKERFIKYIVPKLLQDGYRTPLWVRKLILIAWNQSAQSFRPAHITKNWEELYQLAEESGITFESEDEDSIVVVSNHCKQIYEELVREKTHRYIIFYIKDEYEIDVEFVGARNEDYDEFLTDLQIAGANECRYGLYDLEYTTDSSGTSTDTHNIQKMFLMLWCPNAATNETRNMYKRSMDVLKQCLKDVKDFVEATNISEARLSVIKAKLQENSATEEDQIQIIDDSDDSMEVENGS